MTTRLYIQYPEDWYRVPSAHVAELAGKRRLMQQYLSNLVVWASCVHYDA